MLTTAASFTSYIDVAQVVLYAFWLFFAGLVYYLRREDKREGYPLEAEGRPNPRSIVQGFPAMPPPKTFRLGDGRTVVVPNPERDARELRARPTSRTPGSPLEPTGDPLRDGVGPASWANRPDHPDLTFGGELKIVPLRAAPGFSLEPRDPDPRGLDVQAGDGVVVGKVADVWVDRSEVIIRYLEVELAGGGKRLLPSGFWHVDERRKRVEVRAIFSPHFAHVPTLAKPDSITLLEEDKIVAYFGGGLLYADPARMGPLL